MAEAKEAPVGRINIEGRLSFPALFTPEAFKPGDPLKYKATVLVPQGGAQAKMIGKAIKAVATEKWKDKADKILKSIRGNPNKFCFQDGDTKEYDGYEGMMSLAASSKVRPTVIDRDKSPLTESDGKPYAGCYVRVSMDIFAYENSGNGISASLRGVQFVRDGDAFGGGAPASADEFEDLAVDDDDDSLVG